MTDDDSNNQSRRPNPDRRASPFDEGFVTLWRQPAASTSGREQPKDDPFPPSDLLPDAWGEGDDRSILIDIDDIPDDGEVDESIAGPVAVRQDEPVDIAIDALRSDDAIAERDAAQAALRPVLRSLEAVGLYAYITLDDENRWAVASDDEQGRVDVRLDDGDYEVVMAATSPGMYADEDNAYRRRSLERLARMLIPRVARGYLADHQKASWDDVESGVAVSVRYVLPRAEPAAVGPFVREHFEELEELLSFVEEHISR